MVAAYFLLAILFHVSVLLNVEKIEKESFKSNWEEHKKTHNLQLTDEENRYRFSIYMENVEFIEKINSLDLSYKLKINHFGHLNHEEYKNMLLKSVRPEPLNNGFSYGDENGFENHEDIDWRKKGIVTGVKQQGFCGSCYTFSTTGHLEGQYTLLTNKSVLLSEQDILDCSSTYGNDGCDGGDMTYSFKYVSDFGINTEDDYKYTAHKSSCKHNNKTAILKVKKYFSIKSGSEKILQRAISQIGPISVAIDAKDREFQFYSSGVYVSKSCGNKDEDLEHAVLVVGMGTDSVKHYIVKNSWGVGWGDEGYILMGRDMNNMCGIATSASFAKVNIL